jgi:hypothetical protein
MVDNDAPPNSLINLIVSPNVKIVKGKRVGACALVCNISRVKGHVEALGWD